MQSFKDDRVRVVQETVGLVVTGRSREDPWVREAENNYLIKSGGPGQTRHDV